MWVTAFLHAPYRYILVTKEKNVSLSPMLLPSFSLPGVAYVLTKVLYMYC